MSARQFTHARFEEQLSQRQLAGARCQTCGALHLPPRPLCPTCHDQNLVWETLSGRGVLVAFTVVHIAPSAMMAAGFGRDNPYVTGIVRLEEGPAISARILGADPKHPESIQIGAPVSVVFPEQEEGGSPVLAFAIATKA